MSVQAGPDIVTDGLVLLLDADNEKSLRTRENLLANSQATVSTWGEKTSNTSFNNLNLNALGLFQGVEVVSNTGEEWHRIGSGFNFSIVNAQTYTLSFWYRAGTTNRARLQIRSDGQESYVQGPVNGSAWAVQSTVGAISNITTTLLEDGLTYRTSYTLVSNRSATASLGIGIGLGDFIPGKTVIALAAQIERDIVISEYTATTGTAIVRPTGWIDLTGNNNGTTSESPAISQDSTGRSIKLDNLNEVTVNLAVPVNKFQLTFSYWGRSTAIPSSNYRRIWRLIDSVNPHGYYFIGDTREVATPSILHYVKDFTVSDWDTRSMLSQSDFLQFQWNNYVLIVTAENDWQSYRNGTFLGTNTTPSQDLSGYGNVVAVSLGGVNTNFEISDVMMYNRVLTSAEVQKNYEAQKWRYGI